MLQDKKIVLISNSSISYPLFHSWHLIYFLCWHLSSFKYLLFLSLSFHYLIETVEPWPKDRQTLLSIRIRRSVWKSLKSISSQLSFHLFVGCNTFQGSRISTSFSVFFIFIIFTYRRDSQQLLQPHHHHLLILLVWTSQSVSQSATDRHCTYHGEYREKQRTRENRTELHNTGLAFNLNHIFSPSPRLASSHLCLHCCTCLPGRWESLSHVPCSKGHLCWTNWTRRRRRRRECLCLFFSPPRLLSPFVSSSGMSFNGRNERTKRESSFNWIAQLSSALELLDQTL